MFSLTPDARNEIKNLIKESILEMLSENPKMFSLTSEQDDLLNVAGVAQLLKCSTSQVLDLCQARKLPCCKPGKSYVFFKSEIIEWVESHRVKLPDTID